MRGPRLSAALWGTVLLALAGAWLLFSPALVGYRPAGGGAWGPATVNGVVVGGALLLVGVAALVAQILFWARDRAAASAASEPSPSRRGGGGTPPAA